MPRTITSLAAIVSLAAPLAMVASTPEEGPTRTLVGSGVAASAGTDAVTPTQPDDDVRAAVANAALSARAEVEAYHGARPPEYGIGPRAALQKMVDDGAVGISARIETAGWTWAEARGVRGLNDDTPASADDRFRVASITKTMVATLVLQEVENGTLALDTPVEEVLPGLFPEHPGITVADLLAHVSGAPMGTDIMLALRMDDPADLEEFFEVLGDDYSYADHIDAANLGWEHEPGEGFTYSNAGYVALGMMLEEVTGTEVATLAQQRIFDPVGMTSSEYPEDAGAAGDWIVDAAYIGETDEPWRDIAHFDPDVFSHAGAALSTTGDVSAFTRALLTGELLEPETVATMIDPANPALDETYGLGIYRVPDPCAEPGEEAWLYGHDGLSYGTLSIVLTAPDGERQLSVGVTGRNLSTDPEALYNLDELLIPMFVATCW